MIPEKTIREIADRLDAVEVIGSYMTLKKAGRLYKGLCPFHQEKTPSFSVYPDKQFFICYGCGAAGDLIAFVMRNEQMEFQEAVETLAQRAGVVIQQTGGGVVSKARQQLYVPLQLAADFYHRFLLEDKQAQAARDYLHTRGIQETTWKTLGLGFAPSGWEQLLHRAQAEKIAPELLEKAGLVIRRESAEGVEGTAGWYDRFRDRVIFPIRDVRGRVIGFGGRALTTDERTPKYINSPETDLYRKGQILYGMDRSAAQIRERDFCIVVEGYMDVATPFQHGVQNIVASMGTALTETQVRLLRRYTRHVVMVYDSDSAGQLAALRGLDLFLEAEMRVRVAVLPAGMDPDSMIREKGLDAFVQSIRDSKDFFDYKLNLLNEQFNPKEVGGQVRICEEMLPTIQRIPNAIQRGECIKRLGSALNVDEALLWEELKRAKQGKPQAKPSEIIPVGIAPIRTAEDDLAALLLETPGWIGEVERQLSVDQLQDPSVKQLVSWIQDRYQKDDLPADTEGLLRAMPRGSEVFQSRLIRWQVAAETFEDTEGALEKVLRRIIKQRQTVFFSGLQESLKEAEQAGDETRQNELLLQMNQLMKTGSKEAT